MPLLLYKMLLNDWLNHVSLPEVEADGLIWDVTQNR